MDVLFVLIKKLLPLYGLIGLGFLAGKKLKLDPVTISTLLLYLVSPLVFFHSTASMPFSYQALLLPLVVYVTACSISFLVYQAGPLVWRKPTALRNLAAFTAGTGNTGYFGIPVVLMVFGESAVGYNVLFIVGTVLFENTLGFYYAARGGFSRREALTKMIRLPSVYAFIIGLAFSYFHFQFPAELNNVFLGIRGAYSFLGMMLIGLALSTGKFEPDYRFMGISFLAKFIAWPLALGTFAWFDFHYWGILPVEIIRVALLISAVPLAANTVVVATLLKTEPKKISFAVLISTAVSLLSIPAMIAYGLGLLTSP